GRGGRARPEGSARAGHEVHESDAARGLRRGAEGGLSGPAGRVAVLNCGNMEGCCGAIPGDASTPRACPACGCDGSHVELITLKAPLRPEAPARLRRGAHLFCASPACPVVYFGADGVFCREDVLVPVYQKE